MKRLHRDEILKNGIKWREGLIPLLYSKHAKERLSERVDGELIVAPTVLRITKENLYNGETTNGKRLIQACVRLDYKKDKWMYIALVIGNGLVKSVWVESKYKKNDRKTDCIRKEMGIISEDLVREIPQKPNKWEIYLWRIKKFLFPPYFTKS